MISHMQQQKPLYGGKMISSVSFAAENALKLEAQHILLQQFCYFISVCAVQRVLY